ncbi:MAG: shikimate kinase [Chthoniobacterales bacterium]
MAERGEAIVLIGFMGTGKSATAAELCLRTGLPIFDIDAMVAAKLKSPITRIFETLGEEAFRDEETSALGSIPRVRSVVVTGGGCVLRSANVELMRQLGTIVWLQADEETIFRRTAERNDRPLLRSDNPRERIAKLLAAREDLYRDAAEISIDTRTRTPRDVADAVLAELPRLAATQSVGYSP